MNQLSKYTLKQTHRFLKKYLDFTDYRMQFTEQNDVFLNDLQIQKNII